MIKKVFTTAFLLSILVIGCKKESVNPTEQLYQETLHQIAQVDSIRQPIADSILVYSKNQLDIYKEEYTNAMAKNEIAKDALEQATNLFADKKIDEKDLLKFTLLQQKYEQQELEKESLVKQLMP